MEITLWWYDEEEQTIMVTKKFEPHLLDIDYNKSAEPCPTCALECKKINNRINDRELSEIETKEVPHILKVFNL